MGLSIFKWDTDANVRNFPIQERADIGQGQGLRTVFIGIDFGKYGCRRVRVSTKARF